VILAALSAAVSAGARLSKAAELMGLTARTAQRWRARPGGEDRRVGPRRRPGNALTQAEEARAIKVMLSEEHAGLSPKQLVPKLADQDVYLASESTLYRLQRRHGLRKARRGRRRTHVTRATTMHRATGPNQVWSWDITWLPTLVSGRFFYLYLIMDVWSRRIVGWEVHQKESADLAADLIRGCCQDAGIDPRGLILHSDNGSPMRGATMVATLQWLGVIPSFSRPHVSNDNPYSEALFRTLKYTPAYPRMPFARFEVARAWVTRFVAWYNGSHRHSAIRYVTPDERHCGRDRAVLERRHALYQRARARRPERWTRQTRNWQPVEAVVLNPEPDRRRS